jgi:hypothetical protein
MKNMKNLTLQKITTTYVYIFEFSLNESSLLYLVSSLLGGLVANYLIFAPAFTCLQVKVFQQLRTQWRICMRPLKPLVRLALRPSCPSLPAGFSDPAGHYVHLRDHPEWCHWLQTVPRRPYVHTRPQDTHTEGGEGGGAGGQ